MPKANVRVIKRGNIKRFNLGNLDEVPASPGAYRLLNNYKRDIYVGSAENLRTRLHSYYNNRKYNAHYIAWGMTHDVDKARLLERMWIEKFHPV